jgi:hypothetical protein
MPDALFGIRGLWHAGVQGQRHKDFHGAGPLGIAPQIPKLLEL